MLFKRKKNRIIVWLRFRLSKRKWGKWTWNNQNRVGNSPECSCTLYDDFLLLVSFYCSIRVAVAFVGFLGMIAHYSQKISVGIALVCMVNHSAIAVHKTSVAIPLTQADIDCPRLNNTINIVNRTKKRFLFCYYYAFFPIHL